MFIDPDAGLALATVIVSAPLMLRINEIPAPISHLQTDNMREALRALLHVGRLDLVGRRWRVPSGARFYEAKTIKALERLRLVAVIRPSRSTGRVRLTLHGHHTARTLITVDQRGAGPSPTITVAAVEEALP
jgi:hypothetical protein